MSKSRPPDDPEPLKVSDYRTLPDATGEKQMTRFQPGVSGNPAGRPRGSRNKLGESFLNDLVTVWDETGIQAIRTVAATEPATFVKVVAGILPREVVSLAMNLNATVDLGLTQKAANFMTLWNGWRERNGEPLLSAEAEAAYRIDGDD